MNIKLTAIEDTCMDVVLLHMIPQEYHPIIPAYFSTTYYHIPFQAANVYTNVAVVHFQASVTFLYLIEGK